MPATDRPEPRWTRQSPDERREAIIRVAQAHFARLSYETVSMADIAAEVGVNRGLIHHYIGTKRDLYLQVLRESLQVPRLPPLLAVTDAANFRDVLTVEIEKWLVELDENRDTFVPVFLMWQSPGNDLDVAQLVQELREKSIDDALRVVFEDPREAPAPMRGAVSTIGGLASTALLEWLQVGRLTRDQVRELLVRSSLFLAENLVQVIAAEPVKLPG